MQFFYHCAGVVKGPFGQPLVLHVMLWHVSHTQAACLAVFFGHLAFSSGNVPQNVCVPLAGCVYVRACVCVCATRSLKFLKFKLEKYARHRVMQGRRAQLGRGVQMAPANAFIELPRNAIKQRRREGVREQGSGREGARAKTRNLKGK